MPDEKCDCGGTFEYPEWFSPVSATMPPPMECNKCGKKRDIPEEIANYSEPRPVPIPCDCGGESEVYEVQSITKAPNYYLTFCTKCLLWMKHGPGSEHKKMGALPDNIRAELDERGKKIHSVLPPPETSSTLTQEELDGLLKATEGEGTDEEEKAEEEAIGPEAKPFADPETPWPGDEPVVATPDMNPNGPVTIGPDGEVNENPPADLPFPPDFPPMDDPMRMEQGCLKDCIYCTKIYPDLEKCPRCDGMGPKFTPARMMDEYTSRDEIMDMMTRAFQYYYVYKDEEPDEQTIRRFRDDLIDLIDYMYMYHFDAKEAFKELLYRFDQNHEIDPKDG